MWTLRFQNYIGHCLHCCSPYWGACLISSLIASASFCWLFLDIISFGIRWYTLCSDRYLLTGLRYTKVCLLSELWMSLPLVWCTPSTLFPHKSVTSISSYQPLSMNLCQSWYALNFSWFEYFLWKILWIVKQLHSIFGTQLCTFKTVLNSFTTVGNFLGRIITKVYTKITNRITALRKASMFII